MLPPQNIKQRWKSLTVITVLSNQSTPPCGDLSAQRYMTWSWFDSWWRQWTHNAASTWTARLLNVDEIGARISSSILCATSRKGSHRECHAVA